MLLCDIFNIPLERMIRELREANYIIDHKMNDTDLRFFYFHQINWLKIDERQTSLWETIKHSKQYLYSQSRIKEFVEECGLFGNYTYLEMLLFTIAVENKRRKLWVDITMNASNNFLIDVCQLNVWFIMDQIIFNTIISTLRLVGNYELIRELSLKTKFQVKLDNWKEDDICIPIILQCDDYSLYRLCCVSRQFRRLLTSDSSINLLLKYKNYNWSYALELKRKKNQYIQFHTISPPLKYNVWQLVKSHVREMLLINLKEVIDENKQNQNKPVNNKYNDNNLNKNNSDEISLPIKFINYTYQKPPFLEQELLVDSHDKILQNLKGSKEQFSTETNNSWEAYTFDDTLYSKNELVIDDIESTQAFNLIKNSINDKYIQTFDYIINYKIPLLNVRDCKNLIILCSQYNRYQIIMPLLFHYKQLTNSQVRFKRIIDCALKHAISKNHISVINILENYYIKLDPYYKKYKH